MLAFHSPLAHFTVVHSVSVTHALSRLSRRCLLGRGILCVRIRRVLLRRSHGRHAHSKSQDERCREAPLTNRVHRFSPSWFRLAASLITGPRTLGVVHRRKFDQAQTKELHRAKSLCSVSEIMR
jgi:hypothetical protein